MLDTPIPSWHQDAMCADPDADPKQWDSVVDNNPRALNMADNVIRALKACRGCPVQIQCAAEAIETHAIGVVRAGIPLTQYRWKHRNTPQLLALKLITQGYEPEQATVLAFSNVQSVRPAIDHIMDSVHV